MPVTAYSKSFSAYNKPDQHLASEQREYLLRKLRNWGREFFCFNYVWVLDARDKQQTKAWHRNLKTWNKRLVPYKLNSIQKELNDKRGKRNIIVKPRQVGLTTDEVINQLYIPCILEPGSTGMLVSQTKLYGLKHFGILHRTHKYFACANPFNESDPNNIFWRQLHQHLLHTKYSARHELVFDMLDSQIIVDTAENEEVGQGFSVNKLVCTEIARWPGKPEETLSNVKESIPREGTIDLESTPDGLGGYFYEEFMRSLNKKDAEFRPFFFEWWWEIENREKATIKMKDLTEEENELRKQFNLDLEQITWRREKINSLRKAFKEKYPEDAISCFLSSGVKFFDEEIVYKRYRELKDFVPFTTNDEGTVEIFKRRIPGRNYLIGVDVARGIMVTSADTDYSAAKVIDEETGEEVARYHGRIPPEDLGVLCVELARMYNNAMICVERNGDGYSVLLSINQEGYANIYRHRTWEDRYKKTEVVELPGWPNTMITRPIAVNRLGQYIREAPENIYDKMLLQECLTFTKNEKNGRPQAMEGTHDDCVFASSIAHYCRLVRLGFIDPLGEHRERYGDDIQAA